MKHNLAPGFRFHPTDEELVGYYLKRKVFGKLFPIDAISDVDVYRSEPWDLPDKSRMKSRDLEWYFFSALDRKYGNGNKTNRATEKGYWKTTGRDRAVRNGPRVVGMKKTLVYHFGRAPHGGRTNWVMHEYRLDNEQFHIAGESPVAYVVCRIFQKSGAGPKNGEQHGAPFVEEEWEDDDDVLALVPGQPAVVPVPAPVPQPPTPLEVAYFDPNDFFKDLNVDLSSEKVSLLLNCGDHSNNAESSSQNEDNTLPGRDGSHFTLKLLDDQKFSGLHPLNIDAKGIGFDNFMADYVGMNPDDETYLDASNNPPLDVSSFIETNDLSNFVVGDVSGLDSMDACLAYFDAEDIDPQEDVHVQSEQGSVVTQQILDAHRDSASSSKQRQKSEESDIHHLCLKKVSGMLGSIPAPPAFASELPSKETLLRLSRLSTAQTSSLIHVASALTESGGLRMKWSCTENEKINCFLSLALPAGDSNHATLNPVANFFRLAKMASAMSWRWFYNMFQCFTAPVLSFGYKFGTLVHSR